ncbi:hypothetical protein [Streptomyces sp. SPB074]|uniref:hypothetical protein n=1 Tax=Streptomyces sp. (strain SPB074) TaxID=465543 RepID=UPI0001D1E3F0|nr:hypothetical protein [Streptomyces sp. SPB074]EFG65172.1 membrane protein [Streptomyces sp. SPB074]
MTTHPATAPTAPTAHERFLRLATAFQTLTILFQAVSAGLLLTAPYGETLHGVGARVMYGATMLHVLAAVLAWKPGGASPRQVWWASRFLLLASAQVVLGIRHVAEVHVPLGVTMFGLSLLVLVLPRVPAGRGVTGRP